MIKRRLESKSAAGGHSPHVTCWFAAWMHDDAPTLPPALAAEIAQAANYSRARWRRIVNPLPSSLATVGERRLRKGFKYSAAFVLIVMFGIMVALRQGYGLTAMMSGINLASSPSLTQFQELSIAPGRQPHW